MLTRGVDQDEIRSRLRIVSAQVAAQERRGEVLRAVAAAANDDEALDAVVALLDLQDRGQAFAVLDVQMRRMTKQGRQRLRHERDQLLEALHHDQ